MSNNIKAIQILSPVGESNKVFFSFFARSTEKLKKQNGGDVILVLVAVCMLICVHVQTDALFNSWSVDHSILFQCL